MSNVHPEALVVSAQNGPDQTIPSYPNIETDLGYLCQGEFRAMVRAGNEYADIAWRHVQKDPSVSAMDCIMAMRRKLFAIRRAELAFNRLIGNIHAPTSFNRPHVFIHLKRNKFN